MCWFYFLNGFVIGALLVDDIILRWKLKKTARMVESYNKKYLEALGLEAIGVITESPSDLAYMKERGFIR